MTDRKGIPSVDMALDALAALKLSRAFGRLVLLEKGNFIPIENILDECSDKISDVYICWNIISGNENYIHVSVASFKDFEFRNIIHNSEFIEY